MLSIKQLVNLLAQKLTMAGYDSHRRLRLFFYLTGIFLIPASPVLSQQFPTFQELREVRAQAHQDRFKAYVLKKLEVYSYSKRNRGMCLDFIGENDGLYRSFFSGGPIMVDLANCGEEDDWIDGRIRALKVLESREGQSGLTDAQVDQVIAEINARFSEKLYDPDIPDTPEIKE